jgi:flagellar biosynthesis/type III secretory pathway ATPase
MPTIEAPILNETEPAPAAPTAQLEAEALVRRIADVSRFARYGRVVRVVGLVIEATGLDAGLGELCRVTSLATTARCSPRSSASMSAACC